MPTYKEGDVMDYPDGTSHVLMGNKWVPMPKSYSVKPSGNDNVATTNEDAISAQQLKDTAKDVALSTGVGLGEGGIAMAGLPADMQELGAQGVDWGKRTLADWRGKPPGPAREPQEPAFLGVVPGSQGIKKLIEDKVTGPFYESKTGLGDYFRTAGQIAPSLVGGGGSLAARLLTRVAAPMALSDAAGDFFEGSPHEAKARLAASVLAPVLARKAITPFAAEPARIAQANLISNAGGHVTAGRRTGSPLLNALEEASGVPAKYGPLTNDKAVAAALSGIKGKGAKAAKADLKEAKKEILDTEVPKFDINKLTHGLITAASTLYGHSGGGGKAGAMEGSLMGSVAGPVIQDMLHKTVKPLIFNPLMQESKIGGKVMPGLLANQVLGKGTHNNSLMRRALLYSAPGRLPPEELPAIDVNAP